MKKKSSPFDKFAKKKSNAAIKEQFKQEKRKLKKEREEYFNKKKAEVRAQRAGLGIRGQGIPTAPVIIKPVTDELMPLNKYISHSGISGRREAAEIIKKGIVKVNGKLITEPGHKVSQKDEVMLNGKKIFLAKNLVYILLNKPKDYITTSDDPQ
ncbi:MAG TPA: S4 domain-containing protein, partial [Chitinophagaceae bacterium]|nr:S4 domain-containing protein [Chitinophagaceae bacterium]